jgi:hypothetical protein
MGWFAMPRPSRSMERCSVQQEYQERRLARFCAAAGDQEAGHRSPITHIVNQKLRHSRIVECGRQGRARRFGVLNVIRDHLG